MSRNGIRLRRCAMAGVVAVVGQLSAGAAAAQDIKSNEQHAGLVVDFHGLVEVEGFFGEDPEGRESSDISLATVELTAEARVNDWTHARVVYLFEEDDTDPGEIDQGIVTLGNDARAPFRVSAGRMYVPFGRFESAMISDPLTLELGETRESAVQVGYQAGGLQGSVYVFNGSTREIDADDRLDDFGAGLAYATDSLQAGVDYISALADSDANQDAIGDGGVLARKVAGVSLHAGFRAAALSIIGEYVASVAEFDADDLAFNGHGARPAAWNLELDWAFLLFRREAGIAVGRQGTAEAAGLGLPETKTLAALSIALSDAVAVTLEYASTEDYDAAAGGNHGGSITARLAAEF